MFAISPPSRPRRRRQRKYQARMKPAPACSTFVRLCLLEGQFVSSGQLGVTSKFVQNFTLSQECEWIRGLRKRSFANDIARYHVVRVGSFHNPLAEQDREVSTEQMLVSVRF